MHSPPRIGILVVAYNAASTLAAVLDRIPAEFRPRIAEVIVSDDHSQDSTYLVGLGYQQMAADLPLTVIRQPQNLGYGGNQKSGYRLAIEHGLDIVVLLHADGQYAPELLPDIVAPLVEDHADAVLGSRMMIKGAARRGGMPLYKFVGNKILTRLQNGLAGMQLTEFHSGYRAYRTDALRHIDFEANSDGFDFDTQIILQLHDSGRRIVEVPIPTYYGDEICYVNGLRYGRQVVGHTLHYRMQRAGFSTGVAGTDEPYAFKASPTSSHGRIIEWMGARDAAKVLDVGCATGELAGRLRAQGHYVVGVDAEAAPGTDERVDELVVADLDAGVPDAVDGEFDVILCADVLEHLRRPDQLLAQLRGRLGPSGSIVASVPNVAHWYPRLRAVTGRFDYDARGILDATHLRFFTDRSFRRMAREAGFDVQRREAIGMPFDALAGSTESTDSPSESHRVARLADQVSVSVYPSLFAYQYLYELTPRP